MKKHENEIFIYIKIWNICSKKKYKSKKQSRQAINETDRFQ